MLVLALNAASTFLIEVWQIYRLPSEFVGAVAEKRNAPICYEGVTRRHAGVVISAGLIDEQGGPERWLVAVVIETPMRSWAVGNLDLMHAITAGTPEYDAPNL